MSPGHVLQWEENLTSPAKNSIVNSTCWLNSINKIVNSINKIVNSIVSFQILLVSQPTLQILLANFKFQLLSSKYGNKVTTTSFFPGTILALKGPFVTFISKAKGGVLTSCLESFLKLYSFLPLKFDMLAERLVRVAVQASLLSGRS